MKAEILKIAKVKSEKEFYKKYPTEKAFMKDHGKAFKKAAMGAAMVKKQNTQLVDFSNPPQAQGGYSQTLAADEMMNSQFLLENTPPVAGYQASMYNVPMYNIPMYNKYNGNTLNNATYNRQTGMIGSSTGQVSMADTQALGFRNDGTKTIERTLKDLDANTIQSGIQATSTIGRNIQKIDQAVKDKKKARQLRALAPVIEQASSVRPEQQKRRYVRPEDMTMQPNQVNQPYGVSVDNPFLQMQEGGQIGGNPTEVQNMYNPGDLYTNLGFEPLSESVKQYKAGGKLDNAKFGDILPIINEGVNIGGDIVAGIIGMGTNRLNKQSQDILGKATFQSGMQGIQNQYSGFMEHGGYVSNDWQPQVIAKFGEYDVKDLLAPPKDADMLRAGGNIRDMRANYMGEDERMSMMQMGGELQTYWGGDAETISQNPYLPDGGETVMFRGQSHDEADGQGRTGIGITYGDNPVEVERGEPAIKMQDGGTGEDNLVVFGDMTIPSYGVTEIGDPKAKGKKFKNYVKDLSKVEKKANRLSKKALELIEDTNGSDRFSLLAAATAKAMLTGADMTMQDVAMKKKMAAGVQNAILDEAEERGLESNALAKGKIKPLKHSDMAKYGKELKTAQGGIALTPNMTTGSIVDYLASVRQPTSIKERAKMAKEAGISNYRGTAKQNTDLLKYLRNQSVTPVAQTATTAAAPAYTAQKLSYTPAPLNSTFDFSAPAMQQYTPKGLPAAKNVLTPSAYEGYQDFQMQDFLSKNAKQTEQPKEGEKKDKFNWITAYQTLYPYIRPRIRNPLDPNQLMPEMFALASNQLESVPAQSYQPILEDQMPTISLQDKINEIQADVNASKRMVGNNPAALAMIDAQSAKAKNQVLGEQLRINQAMRAENRSRNIAMLNDATLKNLAIYDQQFQRQSAARSNTKLQAYEALAGIANKIGQNKSETLAANVTANMYPQYSWGPNGRIFSTGLANPYIPQVFAKTYEELMKETEELKKKKDVTSRNGSIVKAIKNL